MIDSRRSGEGNLFLNNNVTAERMHPALVHCYSLRPPPGSETARSAAAALVSLVERHFAVTLMAFQRRMSLQDPSC